MINDKEYIPPDQQILTFDGRILQDQYALNHYNIPGKKNNLFVSFCKGI